MRLSAWEARSCELKCLNRLALASEKSIAQNTHLLKLPHRLALVSEKSSAQITHLLVRSVVLLVCFVGLDSCLALLGCFVAVACFLVSACFVVFACWLRTEGARNLLTTRATKSSGVVNFPTGWAFGPRKQKQNTTTLQLFFFIKF